MADDNLEMFEQEPKADAAEEVTPDQPDTKAEPVADEPEAKADEGAGEKEGEQPDAGSPPEPEFKTARKPEGHDVPVTALLDEREKRQAAERELEQLRQFRRQVEQQQRQAQRKVPDVFEDPEGFRQHTEQAFQQQLVSMKMDQSRFLAEREFGADTIAEVVAFFDQQPQLSWQFMREPSPYHAAVDYVRKQKALQEIGDDPDKWKSSQMETMREQLKAELLAEMQQGQPVQKPKPPVSLATQPAAGKATSQPVQNGFDRLFG